MTRLKKVLLVALGLLLFVLVGLPYLLPLAGPAAVDPATLADADGAFVQAGDTRLYYQHEGRGGLPIILIHGFGSSSFSWRGNLKPLAAAGFDVYAPDMRGFGLSDKGWEGSMSSEAQAERVAAFMDALQIDRAVLVGNSMGGTIIAQVALRQPDRVRALIFVDPAVYGSSGSRSLIGALVQVPPFRRWGQLIVRWALAGEGNADLIKSAWYDPSQVTPAVLDGYRRALATPDWDLGLLALLRDNTSNAVAQLSSITAPTLILWGEHDSWITPTDGPRLQKDIAGSQLMTISDAGHVPQEEQPQVFNQTVIDFISGLK
jgi:pimeloyl-ACP methyl ester carboxylesterase